MAYRQAQRRLTLSGSGAASHADADVAAASFRQEQVSLTEMAKALDRVRERRKLADQGIFLQADGKEPEWSWRSIDEIRLELARAERGAADEQEEIDTAKATLERETRNFAKTSTAAISVPACGSGR